MQKLQLYIEGQRVTLFKDESVTVTDTIKNAKDVSKVFTEFSRTFSLPADKVNNKIFKHYYNNEIVNGFDARVRVPAIIELNSLPWRQGYVKLEGVDLANNNANRYKITFFGNTISLKNLIGDDQLTDLRWLNNFNTKENGDQIIYNEVDIEEYLTTELDKTVDSVTYSKPIQVPLVTHTQRLYYNAAQNLEDSGNLHYHTGTGNPFDHGVKWNELKYSIKLSTIIAAIQRPISEGGYGITFSNDFFNNASNTAFNDLSLWLHRIKGQATNGGQDFNTSKQVAGWADDNTGVAVFMNNSIFGVLLNNTDSNFLDLVTTSTESYSYEIFVIETTFPNPSLPAASVYVSGTVSGSSTALLPKQTGLFAEYYVVVTSSKVINFNSVTWRNNNAITPKSFVLLNWIKTIEFGLVVTQQLPKMGVLSFLTEIFKMFNLVTYLENDIVVVKKLDEFYNTGVSYDVTKYLDVSKSQSNVALPFRRINFSYTGLGTFLAKQHDQLFNQEWGKIEYNQGNTGIEFSGEIYDYSTAFEHFKFERIIDINNPNPPTDIQWGWCVDDNKESFIGKPIIFYTTLKTAAISFVDEVDIDNVAISKKSIATYIAPCNSNMNVALFADQPSINFNAEIDEWTGLVNPNTLFLDYHSNYIADVFKKSNRLTKVTAYLPMRILLNYNLADRFIIHDQQYKINSITTNFKTGKSDIELLNDF
tara:strand:+ start:343 stop:2451 length:2109 start_codon:yes stop_codon:yes gene_type:complete